MTRRLKRTALAEQDYDEIFLYIAEQNIPAAEQLLRTFDAKLELLLLHPEIGQLRPEVGEDVRHFPVGRYILFYREAPDGIELLRMIHGARDIVDLMDDFGFSGDEN